MYPVEHKNNQNGLQQNNNKTTTINRLSSFIYDYSYWSLKTTSQTKFIFLNITDRTELIFYFHYLQDSIRNIILSWCMGLLLYLFLLIIGMLWRAGKLTVCPLEIGKDAIPLH